MQNSKSFIKKAVLVFASGTFLSRILGLARDMLAAAIFKPEYTDIFVVAYKIPNLLRNILGESAVTLSVVPVLSDTIKQSEIDGNKERLNKVINSIFTVMLITLIIVTVLGVIFVPEICKLVAPRLFEKQSTGELTIFMSRVMFPYIALISVTAIYMGILNSVGHFFATSIHPVFFNLSLIITALLSSHFNPSITSQAYGVIIGGILQLFIHIPYLKKKKLVPKITFKIETAEVKRTLKLLAPSLLSASAIPITVAINTYFASQTGVGGVSYLFWADRLVQLPIGILAVALGTAILPVLSRNSGDPIKLMSNYSYAFKICSLIMLPVSVIFMALSFPIVKVLFQRGEFDLASAKATASVFFFLAITLFPAGIIRITVPLFYSVKSSLAPAMMSIYSLIINTVICILTVPHFGINGVAIAITASSTFNCCLLLIIFSKKHMPLNLWDKKFFIKLFIITLLSYISTQMIVSMHNWDLKNALTSDIIWLTWAAVAGFGFFGISAYVTGLTNVIRSKE